MKSSISAIYTRAGRRPAFTLVEAIMAVAICGGMLAMAMTSFAAVGRVRLLQAERQQGTALGEQLLIEVLQCAFADPGQPWLRTGRPTWSCVTDYAGYVEARPAEKDGTPMGGCSGWKRSVIVEDVDAAAPMRPKTGSSVRRVTVIVTAPSGRMWSLSGLRSSFGAYEATPATATHFLTYGAVELRVGTNAAPVRRTGHPLNVTTSQ